MEENLEKRKCSEWLKVQNQHLKKFGLECPSVCYKFPPFPENPKWAAPLICESKIMAIIVLLGPDQRWLGDEKS